jgi:CheY-like chemotaxis protein
VVQSDSVASALEAFASTPVDLIVADLGMPDVDGYELIDRVRSVRTAREDVPALAVSAYSRAGDRERALAAGFGAYCPKPVDATEFLGIVSRLVRSRAAAGS